MAIDRERARRFNDYILELEDNLDFNQQYEVFKAKLLDLIQRGQIDAESVREFTAQVKQVFDPELRFFADKMQSQYDGIITAANSEYADIGGDIQRNLPRIERIERVNAQRLGEYSTLASTEMAKIIRKSLAEGDRFETIAKNLKGVDDKLTSYANTIARTQIKGYGQTTKTEKARIGAVFFFEYDGIIREESRLFCRELRSQSNPIFHLKDIEQMQNGHRLPVITYRGGYRCHHDWEPDPFVQNEQYSVNFYSLKEGKQTLKLAKSDIK